MANHAARGRLDAVREALARMSREERVQALAAVCRRLKAAGWRHRWDGENWRAALKRHREKHGRSRGY